MAKKDEKKDELKPGIYVIHAYNVNEQGDQEVISFTDGEFVAEIAPSGAIAVFEVVPDLSGKGGTTGKMRRFINKNEWAQVVHI